MCIARITRLDGGQQRLRLLGKSRPQFRDPGAQGEVLPYQIGFVQNPKGNGQADQRGDVSDLRERHSLF